MNALWIVIGGLLLLALVLLIVAAVPKGKETSNGFIPANFEATQAGWKYKGGDWRLTPTTNPRHRH